MPVLFTVQNFQVREYMHLALEKQENTDLMVAALRLVMLNALRAAPHYIGAYYIAGVSGTLPEREKVGYPMHA